MKSKDQVIWLFYTDVSQARNIKLLLKKDFSQLKIKSFFTLEEFKENLKKVKKQGGAPEFVILDTHLNDEAILSSYLDWCAENDWLLEKTLFVSAMSFGSFQKFFLSEKIKAPSFVLLSRIESELSKIIEKNFIPRSEETSSKLIYRKPGAPASSLDKLAEQLEKIYYGDGNPIERKNLIQDFLQKMIPRFKEESPVKNRMQYILGIIEQRNNLESFKVKNAIKELIQIFHNA